MRVHHYNHHRYYDPTTGRYITSDPIGLKGGINFYGYAAQNPLHWIDPWGLIVSGEWVVPPMLRGVQVNRPTIEWEFPRTDLMFPTSGNIFYRLKYTDIQECNTEVWFHENSQDFVFDVNVWVDLSGDGPPSTICKLPNKWFSRLCSSIKSLDVAKNARKAEEKARSHFGKLVLDLASNLSPTNICKVTSHFRYRFPGDLMSHVVSGFLILTAAYLF